MNTPHILPLLRTFPPQAVGEVYGYECSCGGFWKIYQNPYHIAGCALAVKECIA